MNASTPVRYTMMAKAIHWIMAVLISIAVWYGWMMEDVEGETFKDVLLTHASVGLLVFAFILLRISWRFGHPQPSPPDNMSKLQKQLASAVHKLLYVLMVLVPVSGIVAGVTHEETIKLLGGMHLDRIFMFFGDGAGHLKGEIHEMAVYLLLTLVTGHIAAALYHKFWLKDGLLRRMLPECGR